MLWVNFPRGKEADVAEWLAERGLERITRTNCRRTVYKIGFRQRSDALLFKLTWGGNA